MAEKTIEQKATELFLTRHEITMEEFEESGTVLKNTFSYKQCVCYFQLLELGEVFTTLFQNAWDGLKGIALKIANIQETVEKKKELRSKWIINRDTRIKSQVIVNKPRHLVKKIIR